MWTEYIILCLWENWNYCINYFLFLFQVYDKVFFFICYVYLFLLVSVLVIFLIFLGKKVFHIYILQFQENKEKKKYLITCEFVSLYVAIYM